MADDNVLTRKLGPLPTWAWLGISLGGALAYSSWRGNKQKAQEQPTAGTGSVPAGLVPQFVNQTYTNVSPPVSSSPTQGTHVFNDKGKDLGEYRYGGDELSYLKDNIGKYGITQSEYQDVVNAFSKVAQQKGVDYANTLHFSWIGPGNVQATPQYPLTSDPNQGITITGQDGGGSFGSQLWGANPPRGSSVLIGGS